jgi:hypothetical protein
MEIKKLEKKTTLSAAQKRIVTTSMVLMGTAAGIMGGYAIRGPYDSSQIKSMLYDNGIAYAADKKVERASAVAEQLRELDAPGRCTDIALRVDNTRLARACIVDMLNNDRAVQADFFLKDMYPGMSAKQAEDAVREDATK